MDKGSWNMYYVCLITAYIGGDDGYNISLLEEE